MKYKYLYFFLFKNTKNWYDVIDILMKKKK